MMLVSYDLRRPGQDYDSLYSMLKTVEFCRPLESLWLLDSNQSAQTWSDRLLPLIDTNDRLLVVDVTSDPMKGWLDRSVWDWIKSRVRV